MIFLPTRIFTLRIVPIFDEQGVAVVGTIDLESAVRDAFGADVQRALRSYAATIQPLWLQHAVEISEDNHLFCITMVGCLDQDEVGAVARSRLVCARRGASRCNDAGLADLIAMALIAHVCSGHRPR
ncbi:MAG TPA: hypothetical protein VGZ23_00055 [bacterium]|nr:hypothetical protein [bacterium]